MSNSPPAALLPPGLHDALPPEAEHEAETIARLMAVFAQHGYQRVKPPLIEFEGSLLEGPGASKAGEMFRLVDPLSNHPLGVRCDITPQIARIAATRLKDLPRPLRLSYTGQILRVRGSQLRPEREFAQVGVELIGSTALAADAEVVLLAIEAVERLGVGGLSVDITVPALVPTLCRSLGLDDAEAQRARVALDGKDGAALGAFAGRTGQLLAALMAAAGPADAGLARLAALDLPEATRPLTQRLANLAGLVRAASPDFPVTIDPGEFRGAEYHTGVAFTLFARGVRGEICGGGRYQAASGEAATGLTIYMDSLGRALGEPPARRCVFLPFGVARSEAATLRSDGWRTVAGLAASDDAAAEARRLGCTHLYLGGQVTAL